MKYGKKVLAMSLSAVLMAGMVNSVPVLAEEVTAETETLAETETPMEPGTPEETGTSTGTETPEETGTSTGTETPEETGMSTGAETPEETGTSTGTEIPEETGMSTGTEISAETKAATVTTSGSCGENATYSLVDGVLTISGSGKITSNPWDDKYTNDIKTVVIQKGITDIGEWIFLEHSNLTSVSLPAGLKSIESGAFSRCTSLTSINIPSGVTRIGDNAFFYCTSLTSISLPAGLTSIEKGTFSKCSSLTSISLPAGLTSIGNSAFAECSSLKSISLPTGLTSIGEIAFMECSSLTSISIPESVTSMGGFVFTYCSSLKSISLPTGLTSIGEAAFYGCYSLASISIPEKVTSIGQLAFYDCIGLKKISISTGLTSIGYGAFSSLPSLEEIKVADGNPAYTVINGCLLTKDKRTLLIVPAKKQGVLSIPEGVKNIEEAAVENCVSLTKIMVPASVTNIKNKGLLIESTAPSIYFYGDAVEDTGDMFYDQWYDTEQFQEKYETSPSFRLSYEERLERASNIKIYTLEGTKGWEKLKEAYPRAQWLTYSNKSYYNLLKDGGTWDGTYYTRAEGMIAKNAFFFDGAHTYYLQADGTPMKDRLTYHPDGKHIIYFDKDGHEVFNDFQYCSSVGYTCYFDSNGYIYKDQITFMGDKVYYLNANGKLENEGWFQFANGRDFGYANWDGTLKTGGFSYDPWGRVVFYHWNGMVARGLITDGAYYYLMDETDGHYLGSFPVN